MLLPPRQRDQLHQILVEGHLRICVDKEWTQTPDLVGVVERSLNSQDLRIVRIATPDRGELKIRDFLAQLSAVNTRSPDQRAADVDSVTIGFHDLVRRNAGSEQTVLLIDGSRDLQAAAWSYVRMACRTAPHLRVAFAGPDEYATIMRATGLDGLGERPVTTLRLTGSSDDAELSLIAALQGRSSVDDAVRRIKSAVDQAEAPSPRPPPFDPKQYMTEPEPETRGFLAIKVAAGIAAAVMFGGLGYWQISKRAASPPPVEQVSIAPEAASKPEAAETAPRAITTVEAETAPVTPQQTAMLGPTAGERRGDTVEPLPLTEPVPKAAPEPQLASMPAVIPAAEAAVGPQVASGAILAPDKPVAPPPKPPGAVVNADSLVQRGDALLKNGDGPGARVLYEVAAEAGFARGAMAMAGTYDPGLIAGLRATGLRPDLARAIVWYRRALDLGDRGAAGRLQALRAPPSPSSRLTDRQP